MSLAEISEAARLLHDATCASSDGAKYYDNQKLTYLYDMSCELKRLETANPPAAASTCSICLDEIGEADTCTPECGHQVHSSCLFLWIAHKKRTCPTCRAQMIPEEEEEAEQEGPTDESVCQLCMGSSDNGGTNLLSTRRRRVGLGGLCRRKVAG